MYEQGGKQTRVTALTVERENPKVTLKERRRPTGEKQKRVEADEKVHKPQSRCLLVFWVCVCGDVASDYFRRYLVMLS